MWSTTKNFIVGNDAGMIVNTGTNYRSVIPHETPNKAFFDAIIERTSKRKNILEIKSLYGVSKESMLITKKMAQVKGYNHIFEVFLEKQNGEINKQELKILNAIDEWIGKLALYYLNLGKKRYQDKGLLKLLAYLSKTKECGVDDRNLTRQGLTEFSHKIT